MDLEHGLFDVVGGDVTVPLLDGRRCRYINFDNAASTPVCVQVQRGLEQFMPYYASIHRGAGFKSLVSTQAYETVREILLRFFAARSEERCVVFVKNTTEAVNKLARRYPFRRGDVLLTTLMEHHSNDLPWRQRVRIDRIDVDPYGRIDLNQIEDRLKAHRGAVRLVAVTGASNVTGVINPIYEIARLAHEHGAEILVDAAQLAPHRAVRMGTRDDAEALDYLTISAHKMYAPYGTGALIGWRSTFEQGVPDMTGGGTVAFVTPDEVLWRQPPDKEEAGSPNVVGAIALGLAVWVLETVGLETLTEHERQLTERLLEGLRPMENVVVYGPPTADVDARVGVVPFNIRKMPHPQTAAILGCEFGIGVRHGCFCAHPYVKKLLECPDAESEKIIRSLQQGKRVDLPGMVRISFGGYNTLDEVDYLIEAVERIRRHDFRGTYVQNPQTGEYWPEGYRFAPEDFFELS